MRERPSSTAKGSRRIKSCEWPSFREVQYYDDAEISNKDFFISGDLKEQYVSKYYDNFIKKKYIFNFICTSHSGLNVKKPYFHFYL